MIARLERTFGRRVDVQTFSASLLPLPSLDAEGITVGEDPAFGNEYFLRADRLSARLRLLALFLGRFEFGTLSLDRPSLILVKNAEGRWNLERWLPPSPPAVGGLPGKPHATASPDAATNRLARIEVSDGRVNFKLGDDKKPFAFTSVNGSVEQTALGRWQINLEAQPWRSGVQLQTTGTIQVRGEVAGTSVRLRPARLQIRWTQASLADLVRLACGEDEGVRGLFDLDATAESGTKDNVPDARPGEWTFSLNARASEIHRWDLTQRPDNPKLALQSKGHWFPADGSISLDEMIIAMPKSNLRGTASFTTVPQTNFAVHVDSAGIQASDSFVWYRAFAPGIAEGVSLDQYFTGAATFRGWPIRLETAAFSSQGGNISLGAGGGQTIRVAAVRGGMEKNAFVIDPITLLWTEGSPERFAPGKIFERCRDNDVFRSALRFRLKRRKRVCRREVGKNGRRSESRRHVRQAIEPWMGMDRPDERQSAKKLGQSRCIRLEWPGGISQRRIANCGIESTSESESGDSAMAAEREICRSAKRRSLRRRMERRDF